MFKKIATSLFLLIYLGISSVSFAEEVVLEIVSETPSPVVETVPEPVGENIPEEIISETPPPEVVDPIAEPVVVETVVPDPVPEVVEQPVVENISLPQEVPPTQEVQVDNVTQPTLEDAIVDMLDVAPAESLEAVVDDIPTTEAPALTVPVEVEENSIFTPPGPEPEPWQPAAFIDPTTESNTPVGDTETHSDPAFLAENSVFVRRLAESVVVDPSAKHTCKVDIFHTDISAENISNLSVKFYGTSLLASYDVEIGSLPNGIDVRFEKNNDYIYDFRGKETVLELTVTKQDSSLSGDFTIPIIYTQKGKKESSVICQLNIINEKDDVISVPVIPAVETVEPIIDVEDFILEVVSQDVVEPVVQSPVQDTIFPVIENILEGVSPSEDTVPFDDVSLPDPSPAILPKMEDETVDVSENISPPEPVPDPGTPETVPPESVVLPVVEQSPDPALEDSVPQVIVPVVENPPIVDSVPISSSDVSST